MKKFIVADDHPLFREAICQVLKNSFEALDIVEAEDIISLQKTLSEHNDADLVLLDLHMPGAYGFGALAFIKGLQRELPVLVVSANERPDIARKAVQFGASGFLPKSSGINAIQEVIKTVLAGNTWLPEYAKNETDSPLGDEEKIVTAISSLTPQQYLVLTMLAQGLLNKQIAYELDITEATVKAHMTAIFRKLGTRSRTQTALAIGKLDLEPPSNL